MQTLLANAEKLGIPIEDPDLKPSANTIKTFTLSEAVKRIPPTIADDIQALWGDKGIQKAWERRSEYWFLDATPYYFENVRRFAEEGYVPTEEDCIMTRTRTTGIVVTELEEGPVRFRVVDVGGQRNERKKWIHCFDDVKALLFVVNLAGYDQVMFEDASQNRMKESLELFEQICNHHIFAKTPIFLCFNKKDIFEQMIQTIPLTKCFPDYTGELDVQVALSFIEAKFKGRVHNPSTSVKTTHIAARYRRDVKYAWEDIKNTLIEENKRAVSAAVKQQQRRKK